MRKKQARAARESSLASGWTVEGETRDAREAAELPLEETVPSATAGASELQAAGESDEAATAPREQVSNLALVLLGVFGGLYILYTWGWFVTAQAYSAVSAVTAAGSGAVGAVMQQLVFWAAPFAPLLWFLVALTLGRGKGTRRLGILLAIGAIVLLPFPLILVRGA